MIAAIRLDTDPEAPRCSGLSVDSRNQRSPPVSHDEEVLGKTMGKHPIRRAFARDSVDRQRGSPFGELSGCRADGETDHEGKLPGFRPELHRVCGTEHERVA